MVLISSFRHRCAELTITLLGAFRLAERSLQDGVDLDARAESARDSRRVAIYFCHYASRGLGARRDDRPYAADGL